MNMSSQKKCRQSLTSSCIAEASLKQFRSWLRIKKNQSSKSWSGLMRLSTMTFNVNQTMEDKVGGEVPSLNETFLTLYRPIT